KDQEDHRPDDHDLGRPTRAVTSRWTGRGTIPTPGRRATCTSRHAAAGAPAPAGRVGRAVTLGSGTVTGGVVHSLGQRSIKPPACRSGTPGAVALLTGRPRSPLRPATWTVRRT